MAIFREVIGESAGGREKQKTAMSNPNLVPYKAMADNSAIQNARAQQIINYRNDRDDDTPAQAPAQAPQYDNSALLEAMMNVINQGKADNQKLYDAYLARRLKSADSEYMRNNKMLDKYAKRKDGLYGNNLTGYANNSWNRSNSYADAYYDVLGMQKATNDDYRNNVMNTASLAQNLDPEEIRRIYGLI